MIDCLDKHKQQHQQQEAWIYLQQQQQHQSVSSIEPQLQQLQIAEPAKTMLVDLQQTATNFQQQQQAGNSELIGYYFGSISRETAEWILRNHGQQQDGAYLLRSSGPQDDFVLSLMVVHLAPLSNVGQHHTVAIQQLAASKQPQQQANVEILHYKIVETEDSFVALHGQVGDEKFATIDELIEKAQGVATKPRWPIQRHSLESQILPPTFWGLTVDQVRLAILMKAKQWGFPLSIFQQQQQQPQNATSMSSAGSSMSSTLQASSTLQPLKSYSVNDDNNTTTTTLNNETIRTLIYKSLHEFQPWFHGKISRDEAERRIESAPLATLPASLTNGNNTDQASCRDGRFLVRERDNFSYAMCISHKRTTKHYRIDVLPTGELAIQDGRKFTSLMALVSHYTIMSDGLWCALTEACPRPIQNLAASGTKKLIPAANQAHFKHKNTANNIYCVPPPSASRRSIQADCWSRLGASHHMASIEDACLASSSSVRSSSNGNQHRNAKAAPQASSALMCPNQNAVASLKAPIKEWLHSINHKWSQMIANKTNQQHQSLNSFLFGASNPLNNHCRHNKRNHSHLREHRRRCAKSQQPATGSGCCSCSRHHQQECNSAAGQQVVQLDHQQQQQLSKSLARRSQRQCCPHLPAGFGVDESLSSGFGALHCAGGEGVDQLADPTTKVLLSCLPPNSGFMLDGQSFVGSPLFAVKTTCSASGGATNQLAPTAAAGPALNHALDAFRNRAPPGTQNGANNVNEQQQQRPQDEKLISPAQSISAINNVNAAGVATLPPAPTQNPYSLDTDIYGSQTSTAIVNDRALTSSSSSSGQPNSGNNMGTSRHLQQRPAQAHRSLKQHHPCLPQQYATSNDACQLDNRLVARNNRLQMRPSHANAVPGAAAPPLALNQQEPVIHQQQAATWSAYTAPSNVALAQSMAPQHSAGPILCGQHAGPAYRYTNCAGATDSNTLPACVHSRLVNCAGAASGHCGQSQSQQQLLHQRAADDLQLMTSSTQLAGPAALSKFVQFQDGQCLRTYRDTRSIQMAYLMSRQQEAALSGQQQRARQQTLSQQQRQVPLAGQQQRAANINDLAAQADSRPDLMVLHNEQSQEQSSSDRRRQQRADFDLMDCDGRGFSFKYDPKLIKSSSIETLCGANDEDDDEDGAQFECDLSNFKTHSELLRAQLQSCWTTTPPGDSSNQSDPFEALSILSPTILPSEPAGATTTNHTDAGLHQLQNYTDNLDLALSAAAHSSQQRRQQESSNNAANGMLNGLANNFPSFVASSEAESQLDDSMRKKHDLDELTTMLLAELTASLKAQVDDKNRRSGLFNQASEPDQAACEQRDQEKRPTNGFTNDHNQSLSLDTNPLELVHEFDSLKPNHHK